MKTNSIPLAGEKREDGHYETDSATYSTLSRDEAISMEVGGTLSLTKEGSVLGGKVNSTREVVEPPPREIGPLGGAYTESAK